MPAPRPPGAGGQRPGASRSGRVGFSVQAELGAAAGLRCGDAGCRVDFGAAARDNHTAGACSGRPMPTPLSVTSTVSTRPAAVTLTSTCRRRRTARFGQRLTDTAMVSSGSGSGGSSRAPANRSAPSGQYRLVCSSGTASSRFRRRAAPPDPAVATTRRRLVQTAPRTCRTGAASWPDDGQRPAAPPEPRRRWISRPVPDGRLRRRLHDRAGDAGQVTVRGGTGGPAQHHPVQGRRRAGPTWYGSSRAGRAGALVPDRVRVPRSASSDETAQPPARWQTREPG